MPTFREGMPRWMLAVYQDHTVYAHENRKYRRIIGQNGTITAQTWCDGGWVDTYSHFVEYILPLINDKKVYEI